MDAGPRRRDLRGAVEQDALSVQARAEHAEPERARHPDSRHLGRPAPPGRHVVLPRARLQLHPSDRRAADVLVRPGQDRGRQAEVQGRRRGQIETCRSKWLRAAISGQRRKQPAGAVVKPSLWL